jgi:hypothetical protein
MKFQKLILITEANLYLNIDKIVSVEQHQQKPDVIHIMVEGSTNPYIISLAEFEKKLLPHIQNSLVSATQLFND